MTRSLTSLTICVVCISAAPSLAQTTRTVSSTAGGPGPWATPFATVEAALAVSVSGDEVWVVAGAYSAPAPGYVLPSGVRLRGGFAGTELAAGDRNPDPLASVTTLNGSNNTILSASNSDAQTLIERITFAGGRATTANSGNGGAMRLSVFQGTISGCTFDANAAFLGPMNPFFFSQDAGNGGAIWMTGSNATITNCSFLHNNTATPTGGQCASGSPPAVAPGGSGAGVYMTTSSAAFTNCVFTDNRCGGGRGGQGCSLILTAGGPGGSGGAVYGTNSSSTFTDCIFTANRAGGGGSGSTRQDSGSAGGAGGTGGAVSLFGAGSSASFVRCTFTGNSAGAAGSNGFLGAGTGTAGAGGGAIYMGALTQATISRCVFDSNLGGAGGTPSTGNAFNVASTGGAGGSGSAILIEATPSTITNSVFTRNTPGSGTRGAVTPLGPGGAAGSGAVAVNSTGALHLSNCTFAFNKPGVPGTGSTTGASSISTGLYVATGVPSSDARNTIFWDGPPSLTPPVAGAVTVTYSDISTGFGGPGNISIDPHFSNAGLADYRVARGSHCIDAGDNSALASAIPDAAGNTRYRDDPGTTDSGVTGGPGGAVVIDIGAYEFQPDAPPCPGDFNRSGGNEVQDIFDFLAAWFGGSPTADFNGLNGVSVQDIFDFLSAWFAGC